MTSLACNFTSSLFILSNFFPNFYSLVKLSRTFSIFSLFGRASTTTVKGRKRSPANSSTNLLLRISLRKPINQRADPEPIQTRFILTLEEFLPGTSLMAGDLPLGPSDAPCPGKTSTAQGESFSWVKLLHTGKVTASVFSVAAPDQARHLIASNLFTPEIRSSLQISSLPPASRRTVLSTWSTKLGFSLAGLESIVGPSILQRPMSTSTSILNVIKPRSVTSFILSNYSKSLDRLLSLNGRRLHLRKDSPWLLWIYIHILRTLVLDFCVSKTYESNFLTVYVVHFPTPICRREEFAYRISMFIYFASTTSINQFKHRSNAITTSLQIWILSPLRALEQFSPDFDAVDNKSLIDAILCLQYLGPVNIMPLAPSSTSPSLLTGKNLSSIASLVAARSTNRDLTCTQTLSSLGFKALVDLLSIFFSYLLLALGNVLLCNVGNFRVSAPLFTLYLISFE